MAFNFAFYFLCIQIRSLLKSRVLYCQTVLNYDLKYHLIIISGASTDTNGTPLHLTDGEKQPVLLKFKLNWRLYVYPLYTHLLICPNNAFVSHLKHFPGFRTCFNIYWSLISFFPIRRKRRVNVIIVWHMSPKKTNFWTPLIINNFTNLFFFQIGTLVVNWSQWMRPLEAFTTTIYNSTNHK